MNNSETNLQELLPPEPSTDWQEKLSNLLIKIRDQVLAEEFMKLNDLSGSEKEALQKKLEFLKDSNFLTNFHKSEHSKDRNFQPEYIYRFLSFFYATLGWFPNRNEFLLILILVLLHTFEQVPTSGNINRFTNSEIEDFEIFFQNSNKNYPSEIQQINLEDQLKVKHWFFAGEKTKEKITNLLLIEEQLFTDRINSEIEQAKAEELVILQKIEFETKVKNVLNSSDRLPTLNLFPQAFYPLKVIVGGYSREKEVEHIGDLFREPQSMINLHYLLRLELPKDTEIISDQLIIEMNDEERSLMLGTCNILCLGAPGVNALTRELVLNRKLLSNCLLEGSLYNLFEKWGSKFYDKLSENLTGKNKFQLFSLLMEKKSDDIVKMNSEEIEDLFFQRTSNRLGLKSKEIDETVDKIKGKVLEIRRFLGVPEATSETIIKLLEPQKFYSPFNDNVKSKSKKYPNLGVIGLGRNIFDKTNKYAMVCVFGTDKIETAKSLMALSNERELQSNPLGGLLKIDVSDKKGMKKVLESQYDWIKEPDDFRLEQVLDHSRKIKEIIEKRYEMLQYQKYDEAHEIQNSIPEGFKNFDKDQINDYIITLELFLKSFQATK